MAVYSHGGSDPCCVRVGEDIVMSTLTEKEKEILLALAEHNMNRSEAAMSLYMARNSFYYHFNNIHKKTGLDPRNFYDLAKLLGMAKVTHCGECKHWCEAGYCTDPEGLDNRVFEDDFCSYAERKGNE